MEPPTADTPTSPSADAPVTTADTGRIPRYVQIADALAAQITAGDYRPGDRIPSIRRLCARHDVSLSTAVAACRTLEARGLVASRPRSGFYVTAHAGNPRPDPQAPTPSRRARHVDASLSLKMNLGIGNPQRPTLGAAVQDPALMATTTLNRLLSQAYRHHPEVCHSYDAPPGTPELRRAVAHRGRDAGYEVSPEEIVITSGAKEAVYLSILSATAPGDTVAIESPTYYALLEVLSSSGRRAVEVPSDPAHGIDLGALGALLARRTIAAVALVSNFSNPTASVMTDTAKQHLVELCNRHDVTLVEDDVYGDLAFDGTRPKAIKAFDTEGRVAYCGSFSKTVSPGLRVGWAIPGRHQNAMEHLKLVVNQATATAPQVAVAAFVETGGFDRHLRKVRRAYRTQMDQLIAAVDRDLPTDTRHTTPTGGHVLWIQVPGLDALTLYDQAVTHGIHIAPGPLFSASGGYRDHLRLNAGFHWTPDIAAQVATLGELIAGQRAT